MILDAITPKQPRLLVADLDGTLLHDAEVFEDRFITQRSIDTINRAHDAGMQFAIATARPVSTGLQFAEKLPVDAVIYLNGALKGKLLENDTLVQQAANNSKEQFANSPDLSQAILHAIMDALEVHTSMSSQALNSPRIQEGLKDTLLGPAQLYEALRAQAMSRAARYPLSLP